VVFRRTKWRARERSRKQSRLLFHCTSRLGWRKSSGNTHRGESGLATPTGSGGKIANQSEQGNKNLRKLGHSRGARKSSRKRADPWRRERRRNKYKVKKGESKFYLRLQKKLAEKSKEQLGSISRRERFEHWTKTLWTREE